MGRQSRKENVPANAELEGKPETDAGAPDQQRAAAGNRTEGNPLPAAPPTLRSSSPGRTRFRGWRGWVLRLSLLLLAPLLFFGVLETGLRLVGYGYSPRFFLGPDADGGYWVNRRFGWRFFPPSLARTPEQCYLSAKPADTIRVFILGSSAARGIPTSLFSFGRILEVMLREQYPGTRFEVVNAAMTAINSHVALEIARDCAAHQPDLFIVYMGNNEVVGPYGPGTVFQQSSPSLRLIRASIWANSTRIGQLLSNVMQGLTPGKGPQWGGMAMFQEKRVAADDPRLPAVYANFGQNLTDLCDTARRAGAAVVLSTVAVNLDQCPPLASLHRSDLSPTDLERWDSLYQAGAKLEEQHQWLEAVTEYRAAGQIDDHFADLPFRMGRCLAAAGRLSEARECFLSARDLDGLRFRADSHINAMIRKVAAEQAPAGVRLADAEAALTKTERTGEGTPDDGLFYEHVHMTFDGNYRLARAVLSQVAEAVPKLARSAKPGPILSREECAKRLVLTSSDDYFLSAYMEQLTSQPPFTNQLEHASRQAAAHQRTESLLAVTSTPDFGPTAWKAFEEALAKSPDDWPLHHRFGWLALSSGRPEVAAEQLRIVVAKLPWSAKSHNDFGRALADCGHSDEAIAQFEKALEIEPDDAVAHNSLGVALAQRERLDEAMAQFRKAIISKRDYAEAYCNLGFLMQGKGGFREADENYRLSLSINPQSVPAQNCLARLLATCPDASIRNGAEAVNRARRAVELTERQDPGVVDTLAAAYAEAGNFSDAIATAQQALDLAAGKSNSVLVKAVQARMKRYQSNSPSRSPSDGVPPWQIRLPLRNGTTNWSQNF